MLLRPALLMQCVACSWQPPWLQVQLWAVLAFVPAEASSTRLAATHHLSYVQLLVSSQLHPRAWKHPTDRALTAVLTCPCAQVYLLGPNGQPRKVPAALLAAGPDAVQQYAADEELGAESLSQTTWMRAVVPPVRT